MKPLTIRRQAIRCQSLRPRTARRLTLNRLTVFLSLVFWTWLWGPVGVFLAVPLLIMVLVDHLFSEDELELPASCTGAAGAAGLDTTNNAASPDPPMDLQAIAQQVVDFVHSNEGWAVPVVFALAFGESLAFISLLIPAWGALVAIGALIGPSGISFWPIWIAASLGAAFGDWLSYWIGLKLEHTVAHMWPLSRHPDLIPRGEAFMKHWGIPGIFIGRFFGPLRASVPLIAGIFEMPFWQFQIANFSSAFVWAGTLLTIGDVITHILRWLW